jgi:hypothetical protein
MKIRFLFALLDGMIGVGLILIGIDCCQYLNKTHLESAFYVFLVVFGYQLITRKK